MFLLPAGGGVPEAVISGAVQRPTRGLAPLMRRSASLDALCPGVISAVFFGVEGHGSRALAP